ncbi:rRNA methyltransferase [Wenjunlia vitaminophila]|uniref:rRNA methyltransferase n=1 Tax=Wenjunlia vitaminophila TaxID=76728 RepID=A0A0T6LP59_WENVI|nr:small ribosomal subunit Rsm22 family protein [Wenjunlia vitaminophila]KRV47752.1 rRNA methyltransferase [Wenjunlia vitaminophila]
MDLPAELVRALDRGLAGASPKPLAGAVERLMAHYRGTVGMATDHPLLSRREDVVAYAAYRMPATYAAVRSALGAFAALAPTWAPGSHVDVGGGTGAAAWAVADAWPTVGRTTVLDWAGPALELGRELAAASPVLARTAEWRRQRIGAGLEVPGADLVTVSYVLGELTGEDRERVVAEVLARGRVVAVVEPGTPAGYRRVLRAREQAIEAGWSVVAPCPHGAACPVVPGEDWCHFAVRLPRSSVHRQVKGGSLGYEDEKFSYLVASRTPLPTARHRVLRHPAQRKGMVTLQLCADDLTVRRTVVTKKRDPDLYRAARDTSWGDAWPPEGDTVRPR